MTPNIPEPIQSITSSPCKDVAWVFFAFYSRFEYALKKTPRYLSQSAKVKPNWKEFARFCDQNEGAVTQLMKTDAWRYFNSSPPRRQERDGGETSRLGWSNPIWRAPSDAPFKWVCDCLCVVRNNFFHGGKFPIAPILDPTRNCELLFHGISLLEFLAEQDSDVREFVYETDIG